MLSSSFDTVISDLMEKLYKGVANDATSVVSRRICSELLLFCLFSRRDFGVFEDLLCRGSVTCQIFIVLNEG